MLGPILASTRLRVEAMRSLAHYRSAALAAPPPRDFAAALKGDGLAVIAEVKRRSPSRGVLASDLDPVEQARRYSSGGAACISVLTEPEYFSGSNADLAEVRAASDLPIIRKDFTLDARQIWEARSIGADAVLLIVAALEDHDLTALLDVSRDAGVTALVEVHDEPETERALGAGASVIGVNNRNLATFEVDLATSERLAPMLTAAEVIVAESGVFDAGDAARMRKAGFDAVLVGESLVRSDDPAALIAAMRG